GTATGGAARPQPAHRPQRRAHAWVSGLRPRAHGSVRSLPYSYERMFQSSSKRLRAWLKLVDDVLGDVLGGPPVDAPPHPHPLRFEPRRRPGSVTARPAYFLSPVRSSSDRVEPSRFADVGPVPGRRASGTLRIAGGVQRRGVAGQNRKYFSRGPLDGGL